MTACTYCGKELLREDAHFCNTCGTLVPSHPFSSQSLASSKNSFSPSQQPREKSVIREQVVQQQREKPILREQVAHQSRPRVTRRIAQDNLTGSPISWPAPMTHVSVKEALPQKEDVQSSQKDSSPYQPSPRPVMHSKQASFTLSVQDRRAGSIPAAMLTPSRRKSRTPFFMLLTVLCMIVLGGGLWIAVAQPFAVPEVTKPLQNFKDAGLGVSLAYPTSWAVQHSGSTVLFSDSSQTAQVDLAVTSSGGDVAQYLKQQTTKTGMSGVKSLASLSFAEASWRQMQGTVQRDGVNYTETMLATTHGNRLFLLTQAAPQTVYSDEESVVFAKLRSSLQFL